MAQSAKRWCSLCLYLRVLRVLRGLRVCHHEEHEGHEVWITRSTNQKLYSDVLSAIEQVFVVVSPDNKK